MGTREKPKRRCAGIALIVLLAMSLLGSCSSNHQVEELLVAQPSTAETQLVSTEIVYDLSTEEGKRMARNREIIIEAAPMVDFEGNPYPNSPTAPTYATDATDATIRIANIT